ncbi:hypothetical protein G3I13_20060 [Streptomyces sp. SID6673]|nr:hypothetical protein [Streptomyces sp. SID11726]NEB26633.1 hypothetical protein [Streptomyces sp. SID6673]
MNERTEFADFAAALDYWSRVQITLAEAGRFETKAPLYEQPYFDGDRVMIPRGPGNAEDSYGYTDYSIVRGDGLYAVHTAGRSRGDTSPDSPRFWFGRFDDAAKYFVGRVVGGPTRSRLRREQMPVVNLQWLGRGLSPGWSEVPEPDPSGFLPSKRFFRHDNPDRFYFTTDIDTATSFLLSLSWRELNDALARDIPGIDGVPLPVFSDD